MLDILLCMYPLYLTMDYYGTLTGANTKKVPQEIQTVSFLVVWWSSFGILKLLEANFGVTNIPFYSIIKIVMLTGLFSADYRKLVVNNTLQFTGYIVRTSQRFMFPILNEHFPALNKYIDLSAPIELRASTPASSSGWRFGLKSYFNSDATSVSSASN